jgi:hypothetical protein
MLCIEVEQDRANHIDVFDLLLRPILGRVFANVRRYPEKINIQYRNHIEQQHENNFNRLHSSILLETHRRQHVSYTL